MLTAPAVDHGDLRGRALGEQAEQRRATPKAAKATIEFIDSTVARLRAWASRWSSAAWAGPAGAVQQVGHAVGRDECGRSRDEPHDDGTEAVEHAGERSRCG